MNEVEEFLTENPPLTIRCEITNVKIVLGTKHGVLSREEFEFYGASSFGRESELDSLVLKVAVDRGIDVAGLQRCHRISKVLFNMPRNILGIGEYIYPNWRTTQKPAPAIGRRWPDAGVTARYKKTQNAVLWPITVKSGAIDPLSDVLAALDSYLSDMAQSTRILKEHGANVTARDSFYAGIHKATVTFSAEFDNTATATQFAELLAKFSRLPRPLTRFNLTQREDNQGRKFKVTSSNKTARASLTIPLTEWRRLNISTLTNLGELNNDPCKLYDATFGDHRKIKFCAYDWNDICANIVRTQADLHKTKPPTHWTGETRGLYDDLMQLRDYFLQVAQYPDTLDIARMFHCFAYWCNDLPAPRPATEQKQDKDPRELMRFWSAVYRVQSHAQFWRLFDQWQFVKCSRLSDFDVFERKHKQKELFKERKRFREAFRNLNKSHPRRIPPRMVWERKGTFDLLRIMLNATPSLKLSGTRILSKKERAKLKQERQLQRLT